MPVSKSASKAAAKKAKSLKVFEIVREGRIFWQTDTKIPTTMAENLGWSEVGDGVFEVERPRTRDLPDFGRTIEGYGFKVKRLEQRSVVEAVIPKPEALAAGETVLKTFLEKKQAATDAKTEADDARGELQDWLKDNGAPKDPAHEDARLAQIGTHRVHNSYVKGRETKWDDRDMKPVADWAIEEGCADEMVSVIFHKTVPFEHFDQNGVPEGFEAEMNIDADVYDYYVRIGAVPTEVHDAFEARGNGYYGVKVYQTKEFGCPSCGHKMSKTQKFCGECGTKVAA